MKLIFLFDSFCKNGKPNFNIIPYNKNNYENLETTKAYDGWHFVHPYESLTVNNNIKSDVEIQFIKTFDYYNNIDNYKCDLAVYPIIYSNDETLMPWPIRYLSKIVVEMINKNQCKVALINFHESDRYSDYDRTLSFLELYSNKIGLTKKENLCLIGNDINVKNLDKNYPEEHFPFFVIHGVIRYFLDKLYSLNLDTNIYIENYINKINKDKLFLNMVNHGRVGKYFTHQYLKFTDCLANSYYSYIKEDDYDFHKFNQIDDLSSKFPCVDIELNEYPEFKNFILKNPKIGNCLLPDDLLDIRERAYNVSEKVVYINEKWTTDTYFTVVNETHFNDLSSWITEKTFKMFYYGHPFILIGGRNTLKELRDMGFETFPELFDESYDEMPCNLKKLIFICDQIKKYNSKEGIDKLKYILPSLKEKLIYNRNHFINYDWYQFWKKLI